MTREKAKLVLDSLATWEGKERMITAEHVEAIRVLSQETYLPNDLEEVATISLEEAETLADEYTNFLAKGLIENQPRPIGGKWFIEYARKRFIAGAKWQKEQYHFFNEAWADNMQYQLDRNYENGKQDMKEQMMKEAVEGIARPLDQEIWCDFHKLFPEIGDGEDIRVIIIKKDNQHQDKSD